MDGSHPARTLARFIAAVRFDAFSDEIVTKAVHHSLDTLGAMLAGAAAEETSMATRALRAAGESGTCTLAGQADRLSARAAALVNGIAAHAYELDDTGGCDHSGAVVWPALLAVLDLAQHPVSGKDVLAAMIVGYDIGRRVLNGFGGYRAHNDAGWHSTGTCGTFAAAAAAARLLGLSDVQVLASLGLAGSFASGTWAFIHDGSMTKRIHAGRAAEAGLLAALLAKEGMTGPDHVFSDRWGGFYPTFGRRTAASDLIEGLGEDWLIGDAAIKPHACCRDVHAAIDAVARIQRRGGITADQVATVHTPLNSFLIGMVGGRDVSTLSAAQMSLPYGIAAQLRFGAAGLAQYELACRTDPEVRRLIEAVEVVPDESVAASWSSAIAVTTTDGRRIVEPTRTPHGAPDNPISVEELRMKFDSLAARALPVERISLVARMVKELPRNDDVRPLAVALAL